VPEAVDPAVFPHDRELRASRNGARHERHADRRQKKKKKKKRTLTNQCYGVAPLSRNTIAVGVAPDAVTAQTAFEEILAVTPLSTRWHRAFLYELKPCDLSTYQPLPFSGTSAETTLTQRGLWQACAEVLSPFARSLKQPFTLGFAMKAKH